MGYCVIGDDWLDDLEFMTEPDDAYEECDHCGDNALDGEAWQCKCDGDRIFCGETCFDKWHTHRHGELVCQTLSIQGS